MKNIIKILLVLVSIQVTAQTNFENSINNFDTENKEINVAFYAGYEDENKKSWKKRVKREFKKGAQLFSSKYNGYGIDNDGGIVTGKKAAMEVLKVETIISNIKKVYQKEGKKISKVAIFTHGVIGSSGSYLNFGNKNVIGIDDDVNGTDHLIETIDGFVDEIDEYLKDDATIILYACLLGSTFKDKPLPKADNPIRKEDKRTGGEGSFADKLRDKLNENGKSRSVWGHRTTAHTYGNCNWRLFEGEQIGVKANKILFKTPKFRGGAITSKYLAEELREELDYKKFVPTRKCKNNNTKICDSDPLRKWLGFIYPIIPKKYRPFVKSRENDTIEFDDGLVEWLAKEYKKTISDFRKEVYNRKL